MKDFFRSLADELEIEVSAIYEEAQQFGDTNCLRNEDGTYSVENGLERSIYFSKERHARVISMRHDQQDLGPW